MRPRHIINIPYRVIHIHLVTPGTCVGFDDKGREQVVQDNTFVSKGPNIWISQNGLDYIMRRTDHTNPYNMKH